MARKLTKQEERSLISEAEALRDDPNASIRTEEARVPEDGSAVLSVRLSVGQIRALRQIAAERGKTLSGLIQEAVASVAASQTQTFSVSRDVSRLYLTGSAAVGLGATTLAFEGPTLVPPQDLVYSS